MTGWGRRSRVNALSDLSLQQQPGAPRGYRGQDICSSRGFRPTSRSLSRDVGYRGSLPQPVTVWTTPYGCPTFAPAYVGRKRRGEAPSKVCLFLFASTCRNLFHLHGRRSPPLKCKQREDISQPRRQKNQQCMVCPKHSHKKRKQYAPRCARCPTNPDYRTNGTGRKHIRRCGKKI
jgi:hypothetical protein